MSRKKEAALLAQERPQAQTIEPTNNVDQTPEDVNPHNALRELRLGREIPAADMVAVVSKLSTLAMTNPCRASANAATTTASRFATTP